MRGTNKMVWTDNMDQKLREARAQGLPWDAVGAAVGVDRQVCLNRAKELNVPTGRIVADNSHTQAQSARRALRRG